MDELIRAAIPALLNDAQAKTALLEYMHAITDKVRPEEEWRQVWWRISDDVRLYDGSDIYTGIKNPHTRLLAEVHFSWRGVGLLTARHVSDSYDPDARWVYSHDDRFIKFFHKESFDVKNFVEAIERGQAAWDGVHDKWVAATLPVVSVHVPG